MLESRNAKQMENMNSQEERHKDQINMKRHCTYLDKLALNERKSKLESSRAYSDQLQA